MITASGGGGQKLLIFLALLDVLSAKVGIGHGHDHQGKLQFFVLFSHALKEI